MARIRRPALMSWFIVFYGLIATRSARAQSCTVPSQCTQLAPVCNGGICLPCLTNHGTGLPTDCPSANQPYCWEGDSGFARRIVHQCGPGAGNSSLCDSTHPVCLSDGGTCGCTESSQCASGFSCDQATQSCVEADAGASDAGEGGTLDASSSDASTKEDAAPPSDASSGEGDASGDAEADDGAANDAEASNDGEAVNGASNDAGGSADGSIRVGRGGERRGAQRERRGRRRGGRGRRRVYPGWRVLLHNRVRRGRANGAAALVALALACSAIRRRRSR